MCKHPSTCTPPASLVVPRPCGESCMVPPSVLRRSPMLCHAGRLASVHRLCGWLHSNKHVQNRCLAKPVQHARNAHLHTLRARSCTRTARTWTPSTRRSCAASAARRSASARRTPAAPSCWTPPALCAQQHARLRPRSAAALACSAGPYNSGRPGQMRDAGVLDFTRCGCHRSWRLCEGYARGFLQACCDTAHSARQFACAP